MKILHFADLHLDRPFADARISAALGKIRRAELLKVFEKICKLARDYAVDAVTIAGDLFEQETIKASTLKALTEGFSSLAPIPVLIAPGEMDNLGKNSLYARWKFPDNVHVFSDGLSAYDLAGGVIVWGTSTPKANEVVPSRASEDNNVNILLVHTPAEQSSDSSFMLRLMDFMDFGLFGGDHHFHALDRGVNAGSPERLESDDVESDHGVVLVTIEGQKVITTFIETGEWRYEHAEINLDGCENMDQVEEHIRENIVSDLNTFCTITLTGTPNCLVDVDALTEFVERRGRFILRLTPPQNLDTLTAEPTVRGFLAKAFSDRLKKSEPETRAQLFNSLSLALQALNGSEDIANAIDPN